MTDEAIAFYNLLKNDKRYCLEAYHFVRESLSFAQDVLRLGNDSDSAKKPESEKPFPDPELTGLSDSSEADEFIETMERRIPERHLTGQDLCEAVRLFSIEQFGYLARIVLKRWGIQSTADIGNIVYNLINIGWMKKSANDRRDHFDEVFDFEEVFEKQFEFSESD